MQGSFRIGEWLVHPHCDQIVGFDQSVKLEPRVTQVLVYLAERPGEIVSREQLLEAIWEGAFVSDEVLTIAISKLRHALADDSKNPRFVQTVPGKGYRLNAPVASIDALKDGSTPSASLQKTLLAAALVLTVSTLAAWAFWWIGPDEVGPITSSLTRLTSLPGEEWFPSLSPDGNFFVYASAVSGNWDIYLQRVGGDKPINLTEDSPADDTHPAFSPDGQQIAFRSERDGGGLFLMGATGESVNRLTEFGHNPAWSPDGTEIACATEAVKYPVARWAVSELWAVSVKSGAKRLVTEGDAVQPSWSPHGDRISYWALQGKGRNIWTIPAQGGEAVAVTHDAHLNWNPVWSPDGKHIYFSSDRGGNLNFWRIPVDEESGIVTGEPEAVTTGGSSFHGHLCFSKDGMRAAYMEELILSNIWRTAFDPEADTIRGTPVRVTQGSTPMVLPSISPDGNWLVCASVEKNEDIIIMRTDGTARRKLTDDFFSDRGPHWSPDGRQIAFFSNRSGEYEDYEIWTIRPDGSGLRQLTDTPDKFIWHPVWSPDGKRLAYESVETSYIFDSHKPWKGQVPEALPPAEESGDRFGVYSWSPDGSTLAGHFMQKDGTTNGIGIYSLDSKEYQRLADIGIYPRWLNDGRRLTFAHEGNIYLMDSRTRQYREILSLSPDQIIQPVASPDNQFIYFVRCAFEADVWLLTLSEEDL